MTFVWFLGFLSLACGGSLMAQVQPAPSDGPEPAPPVTRAQDPDDTTLPLPQDPPQVPTPRSAAADDDAPAQGTTQADAAQADPPGRDPVVVQEERDRERQRERRGDLFNDVYLYFPEGELNIRTVNLLRNVLFEGRVKYGFVDGDISTHLRYKYYAKRFTWRLGVFDSVGFDSVDSGSGDFDRVRGGGFLFELPRDYYQRYVGLIQVDDYAFGDVDRPDNNRTNTFLKLGYQYGTAHDPTLNAIAGDTRGRTLPVLTAYRELGPRDLSWAAGLSYATEATGDYEYLRVETEVLKRMFVSERTFLISRFHLGTFPMKKAQDFAVDYDPDDSDDPERPLTFLYAPRDELYKIGGREALRGVDDSIRGTEEVHLTNEFFFPIFLNEQYDAMKLQWNNLYGIAYVGAGSYGFDIDDLVESDRFIVDAGIGVEAELRYRDIVGFLSVLYAQPVVKPDSVDGGEFLVSLRTRR